MTSLTISADRRSPATSSSDRGLGSTSSTPRRSTIDGRDRQTSCDPGLALEQELTGRTWRWSRRTASTIRAAASPTA
jgi:hypothetical protein